MGSAVTFAAFVFKRCVGSGVLVRGVLVRVVSVAFAIAWIGHECCWLQMHRKCTYLLACSSVLALYWSTACCVWSMRQRMFATKTQPVERNVVSNADSQLC